MIELTPEQRSALLAMYKTGRQRALVLPGSRLADLLAPLADAGLVVCVGWNTAGPYARVIVYLTQVGAAAARMPATVHMKEVVRWPSP